MTAAATSGWGAWGGPARAYELTAAVAEHDRGAADAALAGLAPREAWEVVVSLGAQARQAASLAGGRSAGAVRRRQQIATVGALVCSPALQPAMDALAAREVTAPDPMPPLAALDGAARYLAALAARTCVDAGWPPALVARLCRRAAALAR